MASVLKTPATIVEDFERQYGSAKWRTLPFSTLVVAVMHTLRDEHRTGKVVA